jgi:para-nitrobenzyl esterase
VDNAACPVGGIDRRGFIGLLAGVGGVVALGGCTATRAPTAQSPPRTSGATVGRLVIRTQQGDLEGRAENGVRIWRGVPYAQPPVDELRGRAPQPARPWTGVRGAARFSSQAVQQHPIAERGKPLTGSEDCLYLNVWAPAQDSDTLRPVVMWIHGGGFVAGSSTDPRFDGSLFARRDGFVFVTTNYRLGGFGYFLGDRDPASSNLGLLDQIAALQWIRDNIAGFGGDPDNVTVMGQSAGGMSIAQLLGSTRAAGLFHRAIVQSGGPTSVFTHGEAPQVRDRAVVAANLQRVDQLLALPTAELNAVFERLSADSADPLLGGSPFHPAVDGIVLQSHPLDNLRPIPTLIGHAENEVAAFQANKVFAFRDGLLVKKRSLVGDAAWSVIEQAYRSTERPNRRWDNDLWSDAFTVIPSLRLADGLTAIGTDVWSYRFDYAAAGPNGATHSADIPFVFDSATTAQSPWDDTAQALATGMHDAIVNFIRNGDPNIPALPPWPKHTPHGLAYMSFDAQCNIGHDFVGAARRRTWAPVSNNDI